ncbi:MAG: outer membrane beta-barrel protein, partial [Prolixibacteraceae bacterium]|nr:outer membrane beta-barrel protein [Burkholderiales bacterium]
MKRELSALRLHAFRHGWRFFCVAVAMAMTCPVHAQTAAPQTESSVTVYGGYRGGGSLTDANTGATVNLRDDGSYAITVDIGLDRQTQVQLFYSHQQTALTSDDLFSPTVNNFELDIDYYHVGGTYFFEQVGAGGYVVGGIGATHARPDRGDLDSETLLSGNIGVGYMLPLGKRVGLRFEARGYATLINNDSSLFCGSNVGCVAAVKGDAMYQGEALAGLSIR